MEGWGEFGTRALFLLLFLFFFLLLFQGLLEFQLNTFQLLELKTHQKSRDITSIGHIDQTWQHRAADMKERKASKMRKKACAILGIIWCPEPDSNRYSQRPRDFKSLVSTNFTIRAGGDAVKKQAAFLINALSAHCDLLLMESQ